MSVILNALRQQKKSEPGEQGFSWSNRQKSLRFSFPTRFFWLGFLGLGVCAMAFGTYFWVSAQFVKPAPVILAKPVIHNYEQEAQQAFDNKDFAASIGLFKQAIERTPGNWILLNNLGLALVELGKLDEAESYFFKAIAANVTCASCYNNLGDLEMKRNFLEEAQLYYQKAIKSDPNYADPYFNLGVLFEKTGDFESAIDSYNGFLELSDEKAPLYKRVKKRLKDLEPEVME